MDLITLAAAKKNTEQLMGRVKNGALTTEYYAVEIVKMASDGLGQVVARTSSIDSSGDEITVAMMFYPVIFENGVQHKLVEAPFDSIYINGAIWNNKHQFKRVGITSPVIAEQLGITDILWFDTTISKLMEHFGMSDYEPAFGDASEDGESEGTVMIIFTATGMRQYATQAKGLWNLILTSPETKLIFEYENQENIPVIDAPYSNEATLIDMGGLNNES